MGRGTVTPNKINLRGPQRGGRGKMKSSAFAHPTVGPELSGLPYKEKKAPDQARPGTRGRLERDPGRPAGPWERAGARTEEAGSRAAGARGARRGEDARASEVPRGARGGAQHRPRPCLPLAHSPGHLPARRLRPSYPDLARPCGPVLAPWHRFSGGQFQMPGQHCTPLPKGTASCTDRIPKFTTVQSCPNSPGPSRRPHTPLRARLSGFGPRAVPGWTRGGTASHWARRRSRRARGGDAAS